MKYNLPTTAEEVDKVFKDAIKDIDIPSYITEELVNTIWLNGYIKAQSLYFDILSKIDKHIQEKIS